MLIFFFLIVSIFKIVRSISFLPLPIVVLVWRSYYKVVREKIDSELTDIGKRTNWDQIKLKLRYKENIFENYWELILMSPYRLIGIRMLFGKVIAEFDI